MTKNSKVPFFLGGCGCLSILLALVLLAAWFFVPWGGWNMAGMLGGDTALAHYVNSPEGRTGSLAEYFVDFEFDYPIGWSQKPQESFSSNYVSIERSAGTETCESFNVGYFQTTGSEGGNRILYPVLIAQLEAQFAGQLDNLQKLDEGAWTVGPYEAWHALFTANSDSSDVFMRIVLLPTPDGAKGVAINMMGTPACGDLSQGNDLGVTGELPVVLNSFRFRE